MKPGDAFNVADVEAEWVEPKRCGCWTNRSTPGKIRLVVFLVAFLAVVAFGSYAIHIWRTVGLEEKSASVSDGAFKCTAACAELDHSDWSHVLSEVMTEGVTRNFITFNAVDFEKLRTDGPLRSKFLDYMNMLQKTDIAKLGGDEAIAFLINAYNTFAIHLIVKENVKGSIIDLNTLNKGSVFVRFKWDLNDGGSLTPVSLDNIEHQLLRGRVTEHDEPRVHAAVNCVSLSCPDLFPEAFTAKKLDKQLNTSMQNWLTNPTKGARANQASNKVFLSYIFKWYKEDFVGTVHGGKNDLVDFPTQLDFAVGFISEEDQKFVKEHSPDMEFMHYNWDLIEP